MTEISRPTTRPANSFEFVTIAALRARQLLEGCVPRVEGSPKPARRALQEVLVGAVARADESTEAAAAAAEDAAAVTDPPAAE